MRTKPSVTLCFLVHLGSLVTFIAVKKKLDVKAKNKLLLLHLSEEESKLLG